VKSTAPFSNKKIQLRLLYEIGDGGSRGDSTVAEAGVVNDELSMLACPVLYHMDLLVTLVAAALLLILSGGLGCQ